MPKKQRRAFLRQLSALGVVGMQPFVFSQTTRSADAVSKLNGIISVKDRPYGAMGDGMTDDAAAIGRAIDGANGNKLRWPAGTYAIGSAISKKFTADQEWIADGPVIINYTGPSEISIAVLLSLGGYNFKMSGDFTFEGNNKTRMALRIDNPSDNMTRAARLSLAGVKVRNCYSTTNRIGAIGMYLQGAFSQITLVDCGAWNVSRAKGVGVPASQGSAGIVVSHSGPNSYALRVEIVNPYIENITNEETHGTATDVDCDGLAVFGPAALVQGGATPDTVMILRGGKFINCKGRSIKSQMQSNFITGPTFARNLVRSIANGVEVDFQYGSGALRNYTCQYSPLSDSSTCFGASFALVVAVVRAGSSREGELVVEGGKIVTSVKTEAGDLPYFVLLVSLDAGVHRSVSVRNNTFSGVGRVGYGVRGSLSLVRELEVRQNHFSQISAALVYSTDSAEACNVVAIENENAGTNRSLVAVARGRLPAISGSGNKGFIEKH